MTLEELKGSKVEIIISSKYYVVGVKGELGYRKDHRGVKEWSVLNDAHVAFREGSVNRIAGNKIYLS